eukprot:TRINITY_DN43604_c0_g1_i1.p1 TRINITY_DN43604_c0_g1~~TRINITY_DN43604_c0_g1_i1.p1  ORF type:complete len:880 (-),score=115.55 TRINITY_DN43604_c0_g1_i1:142-2661(-)
MSVAHKCPLGLLLVPSLCKRLLGEEICFEDLSFAPALNDVGGGGWYNSLRRLLANRAPDIVKNDATLKRIDSAELDGALCGLEADIPSRTVQTFDSLLRYVESTASNPQLWESALNVAACLIRGARIEEQRSRGLKTITALLKVIDEDQHGINSTPLPSATRRALRRLHGVCGGLWPTDLVSEVENWLERILNGFDDKEAGVDSVAVNVSGIWALVDEARSQNFYYEWLHLPGSARFTGQQLVPDGGKTISAGSARANKIQWEVGGMQWSGVVAEDGMSISDGICHKSISSELKAGMQIIIKHLSGVEYTCTIEEMKGGKVKVVYHGLDQASEDDQALEEWIPRDSDRILGQGKVWKVDLDGTWKRFDAATAKLIAEAEGTGKSTLECTMRGQKYNIDLARMVQVNTSSGFERKLGSMNPKMRHGSFVGVLMKASELKPLRPQRAPEMGIWFTAGIKSLVKNSGKFYYELKLGVDSDASWPQVGWVTEQFTESERKSDHGVGDDEHGWAVDGLRQKFWHGGSDIEDPWPKKWKACDVIGLAVDMDAGHMSFSLNGDWIKERGFDLAGHSLFPAVSTKCFYTMHISQDSWKYAPPDAGYTAWGDTGVLTRPPPACDDVPVLPATDDAPMLGRNESGPKIPTLQRSVSKVPGIGNAELSSSNLPDFAKAVARKTLVANLEPYLGSLTEEFRKVVGEQLLSGLSWDGLQEMISGRQLDPEGWIREWKAQTTYTHCDEKSEVVQLWWAFVSERSSEELPKLFEWCTNYPAVPTTAWKFHIALVEDSNRLPTVNTCMTDDRGVANRGVPEPRLHLPPCCNKEALSSKMEQVLWRKGASCAMNLV